MTGREGRGHSRTERVRALQSAGLAIVLVIGSGALSFPEKAAGQEATTEIVVANNSDALNGDISSADNLTANPGPDGISLREAIEATNNDPGTYGIRFDEALSGSTITLGSGLPELTGGGVAIEGDMDGDRISDVTIASPDGERGLWGFSVASSGNRLAGLTLRRFLTGVQLQPSVSGTSLPDHQVYADNVIANMVILNVNEGIAVRSGFSSECPGPPEPQRCETYNTWTNTSIVGNTVQARRLAAHDVDPRGIAVRPTHVGDSFVHATVTDNDVGVSGRNTDIGIGVQSGLDSTNVRIADVFIARNTVSGPVGIGIEVTAGANRAQATTVENVRVVDNRIDLVDRDQAFCCQGIVVQAGSDSPEFAIGPPVRYLDDNLVRDVVVRGNSVTGDLAWGLSVQAGVGGGGHRNRVRNIRVVDNLFRSTKAAMGAFVWTGDGNPYKNRYSADNRISGLVIKKNRIRIATGRDFRDAGGGVGASGVALLSGHKFGRYNVIRNVRIAGNLIRIAYVGIKLVGGIGETALRNRVICVPRSGNSIIGARKNLSVRSNIDGARGNKARLGGC